MKYEPIDWRRKLTSRKLWVALVGLVTGVIMFFGGSEAVATQVGAIIMSAASVIAYVFGEGLVDAANTLTGGDHVDPGGDNTAEEMNE